MNIFKSLVFFSLLAPITTLTRLPSPWKCCSASPVSEQAAVLTAAQVSAQQCQKIETFAAALRTTPVISWRLTGRHTATTEKSLSYFAPLRSAVGTRATGMGGVSCARCWCKMFAAKFVKDSMVKLRWYIYICTSIRFYNVYLPCSSMRDTLSCLTNTSRTDSLFWNSIC